MEEKDMVKFEEIDNVEDIDETEEETTRHSGIGTFGAMAIGSGLTLGGIALFKKLKKVMAAKKAEKNAVAGTPEVIEAEVVESPDPQPDAKAEQPEK